ncbi:pentraxin-related protein PTX3 [Rhinophrynus dorsalis]
MVRKVMMLLNVFVCTICCFAAAQTIDDIIHVKVLDNDLDNGILQTEEVVTECQSKDLTKWDKLFTMLENSQMRENMLIQSVDEVIKVELQSLRGEMLQFVSNYAGTCTSSIERATSKITSHLDKSIESKCQQESQLEEKGENVLEASLLLSLNISERLADIEKALKHRAESDALQKDQYSVDCLDTKTSLASAVHEIERLTKKLQITQKWISQRSLPAGCDAALLFPMRSPKIYASVHPADMTLQAFSFCVWVKVTEALDRTIVFSYGTKRNPYEIQLYLNQKSAVLVIGNDKSKVTAENVVEPGQWSHLCGTWSSEDGNTTLWADGVNRATVYEIAKDHIIPNRGIFQIGQEKNGCCVGGGFDESLAFSGKITGLNVWDSVLSDEELSLTESENGCSIRGNIVGWGTTEILPHGGAQYIY